MNKIIVLAFFVFLSCENEGQTTSTTDFIEKIIQSERPDDVAKERLGDKNASVSNKELTFIIELTSISLSDTAWNLLLNSNPSNEELIFLIQDTPKMDEAWDELMKRKVSNKELMHIMLWTPKGHLAFNVFMRQDPSNEELAEIVEYGPVDLIDLAANELLMRDDITDEQLKLIIDNDAPNEYAERMLKTRKQNAQ